MADGREHPPEFSFRRTFPWMEIFRCFQVALDPRKLAVAALGILVMSLGWSLLSAIFWYKEPLRTAPEYDVAAMAKEYPGTKPGTNPPANYTEEDWRLKGDEKFQEDRRKWAVMDELAGQQGRLRTMPWDEYRGPNPYLFVTTMLGGTSGDRANELKKFFTGSIPVLIEPLAKFLVPVSKLVSPDSGALTRFYTMLAILWFLVVWGFAGGVITRLAAIGLTNKGPTTMRQAVRFVATRYLNYLLSPMVPLLIIAAVVVGLIVYGLFGMIPIVGDIVLLGLGLPVIVAAGAVMSVFLIGLVGYPLMYTTLSTEGDSSDTFDALSRSINYVYQAPWHYLWYWLVAIAYGAIVTFFVIFFSSLSVYLGKWAVSQTPLNETLNRKPDFLFVFAPKSFGWRELLLKGSPAEVTHVPVELESKRWIETYAAVNPVKRDQYEKEFYFYNWAGAGIVSFWLAVFFLLMLGFVYSFYWSAATMIYLLMRKKVDEADLDEIYLEEDEPEAPLAPPGKSETPPTTSLNVLPPPVVPPPVVPPPVVPSLPMTAASPPISPPPATIPFSSSSPPTALEEPKADGQGPTPLV